MLILFQKNRDILQIPQTGLWKSVCGKKKSCTFCKFHRVTLWKNNPTLRPGSVKMNLKNMFGLVGTLILLQLIESLELDFVTACAVLILSGECEKRGETKRAKLTPRNPMELLSDKQFKKEFRFSKADIPRLLRCLVA